MVEKSAGACINVLNFQKDGTAVFSTTFTFFFQPHCSWQSNLEAARPFMSEKKKREVLAKLKNC